MTTLSTALAHDDPTPHTDPADVLAIAVDDELRARELLLAGLRLGRKRSVELDDAAIVSQGRNGKPRITQTRGTNPGTGAWLGAWWGSLLGLFFFGGLGMLVAGAVGGVAGWLWTRRNDAGIEDPWMKALADRMMPGEAAVVFQMRNVYPTHLIQELRRFEGRVLANGVDAADPVAVRAALDEAI